MTVGLFCFVSNYTNIYSLLKMALGPYKLEKNFSIEYPVGH
ncbi:protein of unknown function [Shewanella benthica]|uniref:Uncharacterized protein n=1 Tax=Shewanella benthica TaxID=43661 RepID=A0A330M0U1_9GAMM|nr:protein of unknown function [Shewanella benthica]